MSPQVVHNPEQSRFETQLENGLAVSQYMNRPTQIVFTHTEVPLGHEGKGYASQLAKAGLDFAREQKKTVMPLCPYVAGYLRRHPEYQDMVLPGFKY
jgi:predicted GNAT family acetyltransferase